MTYPPNARPPAVADPYAAKPVHQPHRPPPGKSPEQQRHSSRRITAILTALAVGTHVVTVGIAALTLYAVELSMDAEVDEDTAGLLTAFALFLVLGLAVWVMVVVIMALASCAAAFGVWLRALIVHLPGRKHPWPEMLALTTVLLVGSMTSTWVGLTLLERGFKEGLAFNLELYIAVGAGSVLLVLAVGVGCVVSALRARLTRA